MEIKKFSAISKIKEFHNISGKEIANLEAFTELLLKSNNQYNLIGKSTIDDIWMRHIVDSAQLLKYTGNKNLITADFGTGAGFPGVILSILGMKEVHLIEKSFRKSEFLEAASKISPNKIIIHQKPIESLPEMKFDLIVSRALAPLDLLLSMTKSFMNKNSTAIFLKGKNLASELALAKKNNSFIYKTHPSLTSSESSIIIIENLVNDIINQTKEHLC